MNKNIQVDCSNIQFSIRGIKYEWYGGFGCILRSKEYGIKQGEMRMIGNIPFHAFGVYKRGPFQRYEIAWTIPNATAEWIREFKRALFCG